jgi:agmatine/peptidylarginine deiminase
MRLPAEWEPHERTLMGWPCRRELWGETIDRAQAEYAGVANAIAEFEPVTMIANPGADAVHARAACASNVEILEIPLDDSWDPRTTARRLVAARLRADLRVRGRRPPDSHPLPVQRVGRKVPTVGPGR